MPDTIFKNVPGMRNAAAVPVVEADSLPESLFNSKYVDKSQPCVIRGAVRGWPAREKWRDAQYLKRRAGHHPVLFFPHENHITYDRMMAGREEMRFADAVDRLFSDKWSVATLGLQEELTELRADVGRFSFLTQAQQSFLYPPIRFFVYRNAGSTWHYHPMDETLMCQVIGSKQVGLVSARTPFQKTLQEIFLGEEYYEDASACRRLDNADLSWFTATVEEGDALYIPPLWWHGIIPKSESFGVTAAVPWRSPLPVIADTIRKMASGDIEMLGGTSEAQVQALVDVAKQLGLERELEKVFQLAQVRKLG